jgi:hypothetical protein
MSEKLITEMDWLTKWIKEKREYNEARSTAGSMQWRRSTTSE